MMLSKKEETIIEVKHLSKQYNIGVDATYKTLSESFTSTIRHPLKTIKNFRKPNNKFWALKDVNLEIERGEVVGIIGRNGAGKSTLLKILSRITYPTEGEIKMRGRVGSLLEVGTGFHPELTGRENIYFNGAILGMKKKEIDDKFDEIVKFSDIDKFLDTPVKRYSSGMYVKLAFSVAAHMNPDILIVDEVLAVGDASFQKKCLGKIHDVAEIGKTVMFVSHNMGFISDLCDRCILLSDGTVTADGDTKNIIREYMSAENVISSIDLRNWSKDRLGNGPMRVIYLETQDFGGNPKSQFSYGEPIIVNIGISGKVGNECILGVSIRNELQQLILHFSNSDDHEDLILTSNESEVQFCLRHNVLNDGTYYITIWLGDGFNILNDRVNNCLSFSVNSAHEGSIKCRSPVRMPAEWNVN
jgi:ABC-type polysaccharide/polyol phosphate transport system ATPase subunit